MKRIDVFKVEADDGSFTVELDMPRCIVYEEGEDRIFVGVENMLDEWGVFYPDENEWESGRPVSEDDAERIMSNVEAALQHFHESYVILRD